ncbi:MAG: hypothetical protein IID15_08130 [Candidatus Marinimicrobia bacterium]|nr:hypothetical protein [Candidatus Neomarinimicrobiota bacterium]
MAAVKRTFTDLIDLAQERLGGQVLHANDEFFAPAENLLKPGRGEFKPDLYTDHGKWMDGWESRRRRSPGHDFCLIRLGLPGAILGANIDTNHFLGNHPPHASLEACHLGDVVARARHCIIECKGRLLGLFERSFPQATVVAKPIDPSSSLLEAVDVQSPVGSLPGHLRNSWNDFPRRPGYMTVDASRQSSWKERFDSLGPGPVIGISWRGGTKPKFRRLRSISLDQWQPLLSVPGVNFVNLQYGDCAEALDAVRQTLGVRIHDWADADPLGDLDLWAAQVAALDLVISVDNSTVHMAGALGMPVWTLLPTAANWRWMHDREDSPWYPSMRLFRQTRTGIWTDTIERVAQALDMWRSRVARTPHAGQSTPPAPRSPLDGRVFQSPGHQNLHTPTTE